MRVEAFLCVPFKFCPLLKFKPILFGGFLFNDLRVDDRDEMDLRAFPQDAGHHLDGGRADPLRAVQRTVLHLDQTAAAAVVHRHTVLVECYSGVASSTSR